MIALLRGSLVRKEGDALVVLVGGVGYRLRVPVDLVCELEEGREVELHVHTHVREDALELFGFPSLFALRLFERLLSVQKIGPRVALALLSALPAAELARAIREGDLARLSKAPGVGTKTAERLVLELRDRLDELIPPEEDGREPPAEAGAAEDVISALVNLGWSRRQAEQATADAAAERGEGATVEEVLRTALRRLAG